MKFYTVNGSPNARKVHAVINHLNLDVEIKELDIFAGELDTPEFKSINPNGMVPAFEDGDLKLWESNAIIQYLASTAPPNELFPKDLVKQADINRWQCWELTHFNKAAGTIAFENIFKRMMGMGDPDQKVIEAGIEQFHRFAPILDSQLEDQKFVTGDTVTLADFSLAAMQAMMKPGKIPVEGYKNILEWFQRLDEIPAWSNTPMINIEAA